MTDTVTTPTTDAILAALAAAGLTVTGQQIEADSIDIHIDGQLVSDHAATALSWRPDGHGWYLLPIDPTEGDGHASPEYLADGTPEQIAGWLTELLDAAGDAIEPTTPMATPDCWETLAEDLHRAAVRFATLAGTPGKPRYVQVSICAGLLPSEEAASVAVVDAIATALGVDASTGNHHGSWERRAEAEIGAVEVAAFARVQRPASVEDELRARVAELEAKLAEGGAR